MFINKNFTNLLFGRFLINLGDSLYYITIMWMVFDLTNNTLYTGIAGALFLLPEVFSFLYGPVIDRANKKNILVLFSLLQALLLFIILFIYANHLSIYAILLVLPFLAFLSEFTYPIEGTLIPKFVEKKDLTKANSMMSVAANGVELFFNAISGILIAATSIYTILVGNISIFILATIFFSLLKIKGSTKTEKDQGEYTYFSDLKIGLKFVSKREILELMIPFLILNFLLASLTVNLPAISQESFESASSYGILLTASGLGSMVGAIVSDFVSKRVKFGAIVIGTIVLYGAFWLIGLSIGGHFIYLFAFLASISIGVINVIFSVLFQQLPPENMIGRVGTAISSLTTLFMPLGALLGGIVPQLIGSKPYVSGIAIFIMILGVSLVFVKSIRTKSYITEN
ncbi:MULTISPECIES: MFS transporter [Bacillaceae]|uniref:Major facilitator superfamily protein n=1 Tax=Caldibacillus thermoamylovorans TaxID=35841 RepID=A0A090IZ32_9BACI|nr:MFS transporter [Caldibacillus thermoamylovorans]CEE01698.1 major facilitator superfamily protein [Caldibacillus thermoamylovorans]